MKARSPALRLLPACMILSGCFMRLIKPPLQQPGVAQDARHHSAIRVSFAALDVQRTCAGICIGSKILSRELLSVLKESGVEDAAPSDKFEQGRLNIVVYELDPIPSVASRIVDFPLSFISGLTLFIIPYYMKETYPLEVHIIDPMKQGAERLLIVRTEYALEYWVWLPFVFAKSGQTAKGNYLFNSSKNKMDEPLGAALHRALLPVIKDALSVKE